MTMGGHQEVQESFDQVIPGGAAHADTFLGVIEQRCNEAGIGIELGPAKPNRHQDRVVMRGVVTFGNLWDGKRPYTLEVYADPIGPGLQAGWQLITDEVGGLMGGTRLGGMIDAGQTKVHNNPNTIRQLNGILQSFHQLVFLPTLQDLADAIGPQRPAGGFFGS